MDRNQPSVKRRRPIDPRTVERRPRALPRTVWLTAAIVVAVGALYFSLLQRPASGPRVALPALPAFVRDLFAPRHADTRHAPAARPGPAARSGEPADALERLHAAIRAGDPAGVDAVLPALQGADLNRPVKGMTALMQAASGGKVRIVRALLAHGADPNARGARQRTALQYAAEKGRVRAAEVLLDAGADINGADDGSLTPLIMAADRKYTRFALVLIARGANVNIQNIDGWTALMDAARSDNPVLVKALLEAGARTAPRHRDGSTALDYAEAVGNPEIIRLLTLAKRAPGSRPPSARVPPTAAPEPEPLPAGQGPLPPFEAGKKSARP